MDFVANQLSDGRRIRALTVIDLFTRECLAIEVGFTLRADHVMASMNQLKFDRGVPERISCDNGSEFSGGQMDLSHIRCRGAALYLPQRIGHLLVGEPRSLRRPLLFPP